MGLIDALVAGLCLNSTCIREPPGYSFNVTNFRREKEILFQGLENQLKGMHLKIATMQNGVFSSAVKENDTWVGKGVAFDLIAMLQQKYEFNYSIVLPKYNALGSENSGIFGLLHNNQADLAAAFLPMTSKYWQYARFATALDVGEWVVVMKRPHASATGSGLTAPFTLQIWLLIGVSLLAVGPIIYLLVSVQTRVFKNREERAISMFDCMWFVYGALLKQGTLLTPISDSTRLAFATWWIFITLLTAFYTANLTAFLTLSEFTLPIKTPSDIGDKRYPWVAIAGSVIEEASENQMEGLYNILRQSQRRFVKDDDKSILKVWVAEQNFLYITEKQNADVFLYQDYLNKIKAGNSESKSCTFVVTSWSVFKSPRSFAYSKNFKFWQLFDAAIRSMAEVGLVKHSLTATSPDTRICPLNLGSKERQLRNADFLLTYYIVGVGFAVAVLLFFLEIILHFLQQSKRKDRNRMIHKGFANSKISERHVPAYSSYTAIFFFPFAKPPNGRKQHINGRDYWVIKSDGGDIRLVPVRTPSALLF